MICSVASVRYAMKCLDKKRIKLKGGETLALNERIMLSLVSTEVDFTSLPLATIVDDVSMHWGSVVQGIVGYVVIRLRESCYLSSALR